MGVKIKSKNKIKIQNIEGEYFVARELFSFKDSQKKNIFIPIYEEYLFTLVEQEYLDENQETQIQEVEVIYKRLGEDADEFKVEDINYFFTLFEGGVKSVEDFRELQQKALLADTISRVRYETTDWELYNN